MMLCFESHLATLLACGNTGFPANMTDATWQSEQTNPTTTTGQHPLVGIHAQ
jgi:hypothetical protein